MFYSCERSSEPSEGPGWSLNRPHCLPYQHTGFIATARRHGNQGLCRRRVRERAVFHIPPMSCAVSLKWINIHWNAAGGRHLVVFRATGGFCIYVFIYFLDSFTCFLKLFIVSDRPTSFQTLSFCNTLRHLRSSTAGFFIFTQLTQHKKIASTAHFLKLCSKIIEQSTKKQMCAHSLNINI